MQEALKEKQQHIEQLLAERDLERCEVAKATSQAGEVQQELVLLRKCRDQVGLNVKVLKPGSVGSVTCLCEIFLFLVCHRDGNKAGSAALTGGSSGSRES